MLHNLHSELISSAVTATGKVADSGVGLVFDARVVLGNYGYIYTIGLAFMLLGFVLSMAWAMWKQAAEDRQSLSIYLLIIIKFFTLVFFYQTHGIWTKTLATTFINGTQAAGLEEFEKVTSKLWGALGRRLSNVKPECDPNLSEYKTVDYQAPCKPIPGAGGSVETICPEKVKVKKYICRNKDGKIIGDDSEKNAVSLMFSSVGDLLYAALGIFINIFFHFLLAVSFVLKKIIFGAVWPLLMRLFIVTVCFAFPISMLPGGGGGKIILQSILGYIELCLWPILYNLALSLTIANMTTAFKNAHTLIESSDTMGKVFGNLDLLVTASGYVFLISALIVAVPLIAHMIVNSRLVSSVGALIGFNIGTGLQKLASKASGLGKNALSNAGGGLKSAAAKKLGISTPASTPLSTGSFHSGINGLKKSVDNLASAMGVSPESGSGGNGSKVDPFGGKSGNSSKQSKLWDSVPSDIKNAIKGMKKGNPDEYPKLNSKIQRAAGTYLNNKANGIEMFKGIRNDLNIGGKNDTTKAA